MQGPQRLVIDHGHVKQQLQVLARVLGVVLLPELGTVTKNNVPLVQIETELKQD